jgi:steroid delta-isomerase-like uncharacterized protein
MHRLFEQHRAAEKARDIEGILATFVEDCYLATHPLGLRSQGKAQTRMAYEGYFTAFPDLEPQDDAEAVGQDSLVVWGTLQGTSGGEWMGVPPTGKPFAVPFANVTTFKDGLMAGESIYFDLATLCDQTGLDLKAVRAGAKERAAQLRGG